jgi:lipid A 3-O-deacylase
VQPMTSIFPLCHQSLCLARRGAAGLLLGFLSSVCLAQPVAEAPTPAGEPRRVFIDGARAAGQVGLVSVGVQLPWDLRRPFLGGELTGHWDAHVAHWQAPAERAAGERRRWTQLALVPTLRLRFDGGRSAWFVEGGVGLSVLDGDYTTQRKTFSTRFNFTDHQGIGVNFGAHQRHEIMLFIRHVSNGGIRKPNPGEDFVQIRYGLAF